MGEREEEKSEEEGVAEIGGEAAHEERRQFVDLFLSPHVVAMSPPRSWSLSSLSLSSSLLPTLLLVLCPLPPRASCYFADWSSLDPRDGEPLCVRIPRNLTLCHDIGYTKMRLPNLLDHDTMQEVRKAGKMRMHVCTNR